MSNIPAYPFISGKIYFEAIGDWILNSPPLFAQLYQLPTDKQSFIFSDPDLPYSYRIGKNFEQTISCILKQIPDIQYLNHSLQIIDEGKTLGEIDFLFQQKTEFVHLETCVKFYLKIAPNRFVGPNKNDELAEKFRKLQKQVQFDLYRPYLTNLLPPNAKVDSQVFSRGILFYPLSETIDFPHYIHPEHGKGIWATQEELIQNGYADSIVTEIPKPFWICPQLLINFAEHQRIKDVKTEETPTLFYLKDSKQFLFVVDEEWLMTS